MKVIHDDEFGGLMTMPLIIDRGISKTCQIKDCKEPTTTIVAFTADESLIGKPLNIGICEKHHKESSKSDSFNYTVNL